MTPLAMALLGSVIRTVIGISAGAGLATSVAVDATAGTVAVQDEMTALVSAIAGVITLAWSMYQKRKTAPLT